MSSDQLHQYSNNNPDPEENREYENDADRIIHRHLKNKDDIITEDDIRSVRVGQTSSSMDEATRARFEEEENVEKFEDEVADEPNSEQGENGEASAGNPITPWDLNKT